MSREIRYRLWDKKRGEMYYHGLSLHFHRADNGGAAPCACGKGIDISLPSPVDPGDLVLMQYTGIVDTNGRAICEGDIVQGPKTREVIKYYVGAEGDGHPCAGFFLSADWQEDVEVIGNIYANPELVREA